MEIPANQFSRKDSGWEEAELSFLLDKFRFEANFWHFWINKRTTNKQKANQTKIPHIHNERVSFVS